MTRATRWFPTRIPPPDTAEFDVLLAEFMVEHPDITPEDARMRLIERRNQDAADYGEQEAGA